MKNLTSKLRRAVVTVVLVLLVFAFAAATGSVPASAGEYCDRAAAGYHHPGLNLACLYELIQEWWASNF